MTGRCLLFVLIILGLFGCAGEDDPETRIRQSLASMQEAAEAGDPSEFLEYVAEEFAGQQGGFDRQRLGQLLRVQLLRHTRVSATVMSQDYQLYEGRASGQMTLLLTGGPGNWLPDSGRVYQVETRWIEREDQWLLLGADWEIGVGTP
jgi:hypothetical protein